MYEKGEIQRWARRGREGESKEQIRAGRQRYVMNAGRGGEKGKT